MNNNLTLRGMETMVIPPPILIGDVKHDFIKSDADLDEQQRKYCRCILRVESKGNAYNPYGVCSKSTGSQVNSCSKYYDWSAMDLDMLKAYMTLHKLDVLPVTDRQSAINAIANWKKSAGETF